MFQSAHDFTMGNATLIEHQHNNFTGLEGNFMRDLMEHAIRGAEHDSSERDPPPYCHPGTRLSILENAERFFNDPLPPKRVVWLSGPAGVGKSAIVQTLAESLGKPTADAEPRLGAAIFFSRPNRRDKPKLIFTTVAYQLSARYAFYRQYIAAELANDPMLLDKSIAEQFRCLIVEPFANRRLYRGEKALVILLDGLDEIDGDREQLSVVHLIFRFVLQHPEIPLLWVIASRPEPHISGAFGRSDVAALFVPEYVPVDSDDACKDVEKYLRKQLEEIKQRSPEYFPDTMEWPTETQILTVCATAVGLFAFAATLIRFIDDLEIGDPISQLEEVLALIHKERTSTKSIANPLATLDALYSRVLSTISEDGYSVTRLFLQYLEDGRLSTFARIANFYGLPQHKAFGALRKLHSLLSVPTPDRRDNARISTYHTSFTDFLEDPDRSSRFYPFSKNEISVDEIPSAIRILCQVMRQDGVFDLDSIELSWPVEPAKECRRSIFLEATKIVGRFLRYREQALEHFFPLVVKSLKRLDIRQAVLLQDGYYFFGTFMNDLVEFARTEESVQLGASLLVPFNELEERWKHAEQPIYVYCWESGPRKFVTGLADGVYSLKALDGLGFFDFDENGHPRRDRLIHATSGVLSDGAMKPILHDLEVLCEQDSSKEVIVWGSGRARVIIVERVNSIELSNIEEEWVYIIPYPGH